MNFPTRKQLEQQMVNKMLAKQQSVTYWGEGGVARGLIAAFAIAGRDFYYALNRQMRKLFPSTAIGTDLDALGAQWGIPRQQASAANVIIVGSGPQGTVVPAGTLINSISNGLQYSTQADLTLNELNTSLNNPQSPYLGNGVVALCTTLGMAGRTPALSCVTLANPITGVTVTNPLPSNGGYDTETDAQYATRLGLGVQLLSQGTQAFFEQAAVNLDSRIAAAYAAKNPTTLGVVITLIGKSQYSFTNGELAGFASSLYALQRAYTDVTCINVAFQDVTIYVPFKNLGSRTDSEIYVDIADAVAGIVNPTVGFGGPVRIEDLVAAIQPISDIDIIVESMLINGSDRDLSVPANLAPNLSRLQVRDASNNTVIDSALVETIP